MRELLLLRLRSAIADKEWAIACANMEIANRWEWSCDWSEGMRRAQAEIDDLTRQLKEPT